MARHTSCPDAEHLHDLLESHLPENEQSEIVGHLDDCTECQHRLEELATSGSVSLSGDIRRLRVSPPPSQSAFWPALRALEKSEPPANFVDARFRQTTEYRTLAREDVSLDFLSPAENPGTLGKLGHFDIVKVVGRGGMGVVLEAFDPCLERSVAVKVLDPQLANNQVARERFCREARAAASVTHEHVVAIHQVEHEEGSDLPFLVMQYITGESLEERMRRGVRPSVAEIVRVGMQTAAGLAAAHAEGLIHRDIKPANILLEQETLRVRLTDFGLARATEDVRLTHSGSVVGTPLYMAPEQARGDELDSRSDLFSLGTVLYEMSTGRPPFEGKTPLAVLKRLSDEHHQSIFELNPEIPDWLVDIIDRLLEKRPEDRFQSAAEVSQVLAQHLSCVEPASSHDLPLGSGPCPKSLALSRVFRRSRWKAVAAITLGLLTVAGIGAFFGVLGARNWGGAANSLALLPSVDSAADSAGPAPRAVLNANVGPIWSVALAPQGDLLAMGIDDGTVKLWNIPEGTVRATIPAHRGPVWAVSFDQLGHSLATASDDGNVRLWDPQTGKEQQTLPHPTSVRAVAFSPQGRLLVTGSRNGSVRIFNLGDPEKPILTTGHAGVVMSVAFSPDGHSVASASGDKTARIWDSTTGLERLSLAGHTAGVYAVSFSADGTKLATGSWDKTVRLWDTGTGSEIERFTGHTQDVWSVAFSPLGDILASASEDRTVKLWNIADRKELATFRGHPGTLYTVAFSSDGKLVASGGRDGTVRLWDVPGK